MTTYQKSNLRSHTHTHRKHILGKIISFQDILHCDLFPQCFISPHSLELKNLKSARSGPGAWADGLFSLFFLFFPCGEDGSLGPYGMIMSQLPDILSNRKNEKTNRRQNEALKKGGLMSYGPLLGLCLFLVSIVDSYQRVLRVVRVALSGSGARGGGGVCYST